MPTICTDEGKEQYLAHCRVDGNCLWISCNWMRLGEWCEYTAWSAISPPFIWPLHVHASLGEGCIGLIHRLAVTDHCAEYRCFRSEFKFNTIILQWTSQTVFAWKYEVLRKFDSTPEILKY